MDIFISHTFNKVQNAPYSNSRNGHE